MPKNSMTRGAIKINAKKCGCQMGFWATINLNKNKMVLGSQTIHDDLQDGLQKGR